MNEENLEAIESENASMRKIFIQDQDKIIYGYGTSNSIIRITTEDNVLDLKRMFDQQITAMKILKTAEDDNKFKIAVALTGGRIKLLNMDLKSLVNIMTTNPNEEVISLINLNSTTFMSFSKDG